MPTMPPAHRADGSTAKEANRAYDRRRHRTGARQLYDGVWKRAAKAFLQLHPLCRYCELDKRVAAAKLVDHFWPHRGDATLFWRREFWVASCDDCHNGMKQSLERKGRGALMALATRLGFGSP